ncbi:T9SS type A sorting domain-containing protein [Flavobacterium sp. 25HG05S-40]|uniref:T9SS type A sorting domain-containing protein n=1 Tax=Flavobacterium sp. 25HG05S-40 TaxID=3458682 RepID=UPI0040440F3D
MKKLLLLFFTINCFAQAPSIQWEKSFGTTSFDYGSDIKQTPDGGYIMVGETTSNTGSYASNHGKSDIQVIKMDANGALEWLRLFGGSNFDISRSIITTSDGGYVVAGHTDSSDFDVVGNNGLKDCWLIKLNAQGNTEWKKCYGGTQDDYSGTLIQTSDGGYALAGFSDSTDRDFASVIPSTDGFFILKLDAAGNISWKRKFQSSNYYSEAKIEIKETLDNAFLFSYGSASPNGIREGSITYYYSDLFVKKIDSSGNTVLFERRYGGSYSESAGEIIPTNDFGFILVGTSMSNDLDVSGHHGIPTTVHTSGTLDIWVMKADSNGNIQWQKSLGGSNNEYFGLIKKTTDNGYVVLGSTASNDGDVSGNHQTTTLTEDYWLIRLSENGTVLWKKCYGGYGSDIASGIQVTNDNGYILSGYTNSFNGDITSNNGQLDAWVVKLGADGLSTSDLRLNDFSVYPNPAQNILNITSKANLPIDKIAIADTSGRIIMEQNSNPNQLNVEKLSIGIYLLQVSSGEKHYQTKFIKK